MRMCLLRECVFRSNGRYYVRPENAEEQPEAPAPANENPPQNAGTFLK